jgi:hypothetical protein
LPTIALPDHLEHLGELIRERGAETFFLDPLFLSLFQAGGASKSSDLFTMGPLLGSLSELCEATGVSPILLHHFRKSGVVDHDEPAGVEELSQSGVAEWTRQWCLLQRRQPYQSDGLHRLWMRAGGSAGHAGLWAVDVDEGVPTSEVGDWRRWDVTVTAAKDAREQAHQERENRKAADQERVDGEYRDRLLHTLCQYPHGETVTVLRSHAKLNSSNFNHALVALEKEGRAMACEVPKRGRKEHGYKPA